MKLPGDKRPINEGKHHFNRLTEEKIMANHIKDYLNKEMDRVYEDALTLEYWKMLEELNIEVIKDGE